MNTFIKKNNSEKLKRCLSDIDSIFDIDQVLKFKMTDNSIGEYFRKSRNGYHFVHSRKGSVHLAISDDGHFKKEDFNKQWEYIKSYVDKDQLSGHVLEIGSGKGYNIGALASSCNNSSFIGIELTTVQLQKARNKFNHLANVDFIRGNFHDLPFKNGLFDIVFDVEAICYSNDYNKVLTEIYRVLKPGGTFISFNGFRDQHYCSLNNDLKIAVQLVEVSMAVQRGAEIENFIEIAKNVGFDVLVCDNISEKIMPNLIRNERFARFVLNIPNIAYFLSIGLPERYSKRILLQNAIAGSLMPITVEEKAHFYYSVALKKVAN